MLQITQEQLCQQYATNIDIMRQQMTLQHALQLIQLIPETIQTRNELALNIASSLIATYIDQNPNKIENFDLILETVWNVMIYWTNLSNASYHFLGSILANTLFHFQDKFQASYIKTRLDELLKNDKININGIFVILDTLLKRMQPSQVEHHKKSIQTVDSQHRVVKNIFYKNNLDFILALIIGVVNEQNQQFMPQAIDLFNVLLDQEFATDTKEKDFHKLHLADIKNTKTLQTQLERLTPQVIESELKQKMYLNSNLEWIDPNRSDIKKLWSIIVDQNFIFNLMQSITQDLKIWKLLGKICKIIKKHFPNEIVAHNLINFMIENIVKYPIGTFSLPVLAKFGSQTFFAVHNKSWLTYVIFPFNNAITLEEQLYIFRFAKSIVRFYRKDIEMTFQERADLNGFLSATIHNYFVNVLFVTCQFHEESKSIIKNIKYCIKVIASFCPLEYVVTLQTMISSSQGNHQMKILLKYFMIGWKSSLQAYSYQVDAMEKLQILQNHNSNQLLYPINVQAFKSTDIAQLYMYPMLFGEKAHNALLADNIYSKFYYYLWKVSFNSNLKIQFSTILSHPEIRDIKSRLFNFNTLLQQQQIQKKNVIKCLKVLLSSNIKFEKIDQQYICCINKIEIPIACLQEFQNFQYCEDSELQELIYGVKSILYNAQNEVFYEYEQSDALKYEFKTSIKTLLEPLDIQKKFFYCKSLLAKDSKFTYIGILQVMWEQGLFKQFNLLFTSQIQHDPSYIFLRFTSMLIHKEGIKGLRSEIMDCIYEWLSLIINYYQQVLFQRMDQFNRERQVGQTNGQKAYDQYYRPIRKLFKLFEKLSHVYKAPRDKCLTSKLAIKNEILQQIQNISTLINLNDVLYLIHKMEPFYKVIAWIMEKKCQEQNPDGRIYLFFDFINQAIKIQERKTFSIAIQMFEMAFKQPIIFQQCFQQIQKIIYELMSSAFEYNQKVDVIANIVYEYVKRKNDSYLLLFQSIGLRKKTMKTPEWEIQFCAKCIVLGQQFDGKKDERERFISIFQQLQLLYNYLP